MHSLKRTMLLVTGATGLMLSTVACAATDTTTAGAGAATPSATTSSSRSAATTEPAEPATSPPADDGGSGESPRCHTSDLKVFYKGDEGGGSAGHHSEFLVFENTTGKACTLEGYPGVSFVTGDSGDQVGTSFNRTTADTPLFMLTPGDRVHATIEIANPETVDPADCDPVDVRGYRVYPPDETASIFVSHPQTACSTNDTAVGQVKPISPRETD